MLSAGMAAICIRLVMVAAMHVRLKDQFTRQKILYGLIRVALHAPKQPNARIGKRLLCTAADPAAD